MRRKYLPAVIIFSLLALMAVTNPGQVSFKDFLVKQLTSHKFTEKDLDDNLKCNKTANFLIFSSYYFSVKDYGVTMQGKYLGVFGIFISIDGYSADGTE